MEKYSVFFYGTLMAAQVLHRVLYGSTTPHQSQLDALKIGPALLPRYIRHRVAQCDYPAILPSSESSACVRGTYVQGLTAADIWRLDIFEGDEYERLKVPLKLLDEKGEEVGDAVAEAYVWVAGSDLLEHGEWDFGEFKNEKMKNWVGVSGVYDEVDEAVEKANGETNLSGGRFVNGRLAPGFDGGNHAERQIIQSAV